MKPIGTFRVIPSLPPSLERLRTLAYNLRWSWSHDTIDLFRRLDADLWETTGHNPVLMLGRIDQARLAALAHDDAYLGHLEAVAGSLDLYLAERGTWFGRTHGATAGPLVAYFSAEFGITECLSIFAGGLGILAGDHVKSASDLGVPLVAVGLLYQQGYFRQVVDDAGWQRELYEDNDFHTQPLTRVAAADGAPLTVTVALPDGNVRAHVWRAEVGRVPLFLLDTNIEGNAPANRDITDQLYGGDGELRLKQEIVLGIGGMRALEAMGLRPSVYHMNEGHSAFLALERVRQLMREPGLSFEEARAATSAGLVFTTHTPVAAGHDVFPPELMARYFDRYRRDLGLTLNELLALGRVNPADPAEGFAVTVLALKLAAHANGVSRLHGIVTRGMWQRLWPELPDEEVPIGHITNGVHFCSWISRELRQLYERYLGDSWEEDPADPGVWARVAEIPAGELWRTHELRRERMIEFVRRRLRAQLARRRAPRDEVEAAADILDARALTIGFARRFTGYKRADLLLRDPERLARLLGDPERPAQVIFAGKAHPRDGYGKELIHRIVALSREERFRGRLVFVEDYDVDVARYLVQGCDVWLNTPRRLFEASGTSGMKAAANGVLNASTLDGWWPEAWEALKPVAPEGGWAIGPAEEVEDPAVQDMLEGEALYALLEHAIVPAFYDRTASGLPRAWVDSIKVATARLCPVYNAHRMVRDYTDRFYVPAAERVARLLADGAGAARTLAAWEARARAAWPEVAVVAIESRPPAELAVGAAVRVSARVRLGSLSPADVAVQLVIGKLDGAGDIVAGEAVDMQPSGPAGDSAYGYEVDGFPCGATGEHGFAVRVLGHHPDMPGPFLPGLVTWAEPATLARG